MAEQWHFAFVVLSLLLAPAVPATVMNATIGVILNIHDHGPGLYGCGPPTREGMIMVEGICWAINILNKESGEHFLPGVQLHVTVFDSCGRSRVAASQLGELYPNIKYGMETPEMGLKLGVIDGSGLLSDTEVRKISDVNSIPIISFNVPLVPATERVKVILSMIKKLQWNHVSVIYGDDDYSSEMFKQFISTGELCIIFAQKYVSTNHELFDVVFTYPIIVLMSYTEYYSFVKHLHHIVNTNSEKHIKNIRILFSDLMSHQDLELLPKNISNVYSVTLPEQVPEFEMYWWERIQQVLMARQYDSPEDKWLADFFKLHACREQLPLHPTNTSECDDLLNVALRTRAAIQASTAVLMLAEALRQAWKMKCSNTTKEDICSSLLEISRQEFLQHYVKPNEVEQNLFKLRKEQFMKGSDQSHHFILVKYVNVSADLQEVMVYSSSEGLQLLDNNYETNTDEICPSNSKNKKDCKPCLHFNQDRTSASRHISHFSQGNKESSNVSLKVTTGHTEEQSNYYILSRSPQNVYIAALFSLHKSTSKESFLECEDNDNIDLHNVRQVEAFLWALKKINSHLWRNTAVDLQLGALVLDTCNSHLRTMALTTGLDNLKHQIDGFQILATIDTLPFADSKIAEEILTSLNIPTLSTGHSALLVNTYNKINSFIVQVNAPVSAYVAAVLNVLEHVGWNYISVVYSEGKEELMFGYQQLKAAARMAGICFALEEPIRSSDALEEANLDDLVIRLVGARADGARAVLLWTDSQDSKLLMLAVGRALGHGTLRREDLFWLFPNHYNQAQDIIQQGGKVLGGALVFSPQYKNVPEFLQHLRHIQPELVNANGNPWLKYYYQEVLKCNSHQCKFPSETNSNADFITIQAVYSIGASLSQMLSELCGNMSETSLCFGKHDRDVRDTFNKYLHKSVSERADNAANEDFHFTTSGSGNIAIEILNLRRKFRERSRSLGDAFYNRVGVFTNNTIKNLEQMVAYRDTGEEIEISILTSQCGGRSSCSRCHGQHNKLTSPDWMFVGSSSEKEMSEIKFYIVATLGIHEPSQNPLECSSEINSKGIEQLEAFLWAVDQVNQNNTHLHLDAIALDSCGSIVKTSRDISDFLSVQETNGDVYKAASMNSNVVAFVAGEGTELASSVMDAVGHLKIPVLVSQAGGPSSQHKKFSPYPLQLAPTNAAQASAILALLYKLQWTCFSVIYHQDGVEYEDIFRHMEQLISYTKSSVKISLKAALPLGTRDTIFHLRDALRKLQFLHTNGSRVAVLLLPPHLMNLVLTTSKALEDEGQWTPNVVTWITLGSKEVFEAHREQALGALILQPSAGKVPEFEDHFKNLNLTTNSRNPWFSQFWSNVFHCRGATCFNKLYQDLHSYQFRHNPSVVNTINSVLAISHALGTVRREICPDPVLRGNTCRAMRDVERVRRRLFEVTPHMAFVGVGPNTIAFSKTGENSHADVEILNYQLTESGHNKLVKVGLIHYSGHVKIDITKMKGYFGANKTEMPISSVASQCSSGSNIQNNINIPQAMEVPSSHKFSILSIMPIHLKGEGQFDCGQLQISAMLHAAAFRFALEKVNQNICVLPGIELGAIILDSCSRPSHVYSSIYNFLSMSTDIYMWKQGTRPEDIVGALMLDVPSVATVIPLLESQGMMQLVLPMEPSPSEAIKLSSSKYMEYLIDSESLIEAMLSVIRILHSHSIVIIRGITPWSEMITQHLENHTSTHNDLCLAGVYTLHSKNVKDVFGAISSANMMITKDVTRKLRPGTTVILLLQDSQEIQAFLNVCHTINGLMFLTVLPSTDIRMIADHEDIVTLSPDFHQDKNDSFVFEEFYTWVESKLLNTDADESFLFPKSWINEFQLAYHQRNNTTNRNGWKAIAPNLQFTINGVQSIAAGLHQFFNKQCSHNHRTDSLQICSNAKNNDILNSDILQAISNEYKTKRFSVWRGEELAASWVHGLGLTIKNEASFSNFQSDCSSMDCTECREERYSHHISEKQHTVYHNLQYAWASILGGITLLGAFLTIMTALYFLAAAALPHSNMSGGTSVLGYLILLGLLLLFVSNLSFILAPTQATCGVRRFLPGFSYALIFAGMLLKVFTTWRKIEGDPIEDGLGRPSNLLIAAIALTLVQVLLSGGWLLLTPPQTYTVANRESPIWRCYPRGNFETHLLLSFVYIILLLSVTSVISLLGASRYKRKFPEEEDHLCHEARWILIASVLVAAVFTFWGIIAVAVVSMEHADLTSSIAHLMAANILLLSLYVPKILLYTRLKANKGLSTPSLPPIYDISHLQPPTVKSLSAFISTSSVVGRDLSQMDEDEDPTQIVPSSLYSLDMFSQTSSSQAEGEDGDHCEPGSNEFTAPQSNALVTDGDHFSLQESISYM